jgi:hypothetical protein
MRNGRASPGRFRSCRKEQMILRLHDDPCDTLLLMMKQASISAMRLMSRPESPASFALDLTKKSPLLAIEVNLTSR